MVGDPHTDPNAQGDAFKTLFVGRIVSSSSYQLNVLSQIARLLSSLEILCHVIFFPFFSISLFPSIVMLISTL